MLALALQFLYNVLNVHFVFVFFEEGLHAEQNDVAPAGPSLKQGFILAVRDDVEPSKAGGVLDGPASKGFGQMIRIALGLCEIPRQIGRCLLGPLSIARHCEGENVIVWAVKFCGIEALGFEEWPLGIEGVAFPDLPNKGDETR